MEQTQIPMDGSLIATWMTKNEKLSHDYVEDKYAFQATNWSKNGVSRIYINYSGGYKVVSAGNNFYGHPVCYIENGVMNITIANTRGMRKIARAAAEKFGMEIVG